MGWSSSVCDLTCHSQILRLMLSRHLNLSLWMWTKPVGKVCGKIIKSTTLLSQSTNWQHFFWAGGRVGGGQECIFYSIPSLVSTSLHDVKLRKEVKVLGIIPNCRNQQVRKFYQPQWLSLIGANFGTCIHIKQHILHNYTSK